MGTLSTGLSAALSGGLVGDLDPDAAAYLAAIREDGATVSPASAGAINVFFRTGKAEGWYSSLRRFYLPIWGAASPNSCCLVSRVKGAFVGSVTHAAGKIQGNGLTGYFAPDAGGSYGSLGITRYDMSMGMLKLAGSGLVVDIGQALDGIAAQRSQIFQNSGQTGFNCPTNSPGGPAFTDSVVTGIFVGAITAASAMYLHRRRTAGAETNAYTGGSGTATLPDVVPYMMARNTGGTATTFSVGEFGAFFYGTAMSAAQAAEFSAALKTLWETCTGLTLP